MLQGVHVWSGWSWADTRPMAASEEKSAAALLDETSREPAEKEEFAGIRVADLGVPEKDPPIALRHFLKGDQAG